MWSKSEENYRRNKGAAISCRLQHATVVTGRTFWEEKPTRYAIFEQH